MFKSKGDQDPKFLEVWLEKRGSGFVVMASNGDKECCLFQVDRRIGRRALPPWAKEFFDGEGNFVHTYSEP